MNIANVLITTHETPISNGFMIFQTQKILPDHAYLLASGACEKILLDIVDAVA